MTGGTSLYQSALQQHPDRSRQHQLLTLTHHRHCESGYLNVECVSTIQKLFTKSVKWSVTSKSYQAADIFDLRDEKLFSAMCNWSNHCLHHLLPSERDTGHDLRHREHSYQLVCYNFSSTRRCFVIRMLYDSL